MSDQFKASIIGLVIGIYIGVNIGMIMMVHEQKAATAELIACEVELPRNMECTMVATPSKIKIK
jgi:hypothetical protein